MKTDSVTQAEKAAIFCSLHESSTGFVIPNPWDMGSARLLEILGFKAVATTSAGFSFSRGKHDNSVERHHLLAHLSDIVSGTNLPVNADLENGFGDSPDEVATTIRLAAHTGVVGGSIEDITGRASDPQYSIKFAADRIRAAVEAARSLSFKFTLTARAENFFIGNPNLPDTIKRLQAYQEAGADVLYAPGLVHKADIETVLREIDLPLNIFLGFGGMTLKVNDLFEMGVRRVSVGGSLARVAYGEFLRTAIALRDHGGISVADGLIGTKEINGMFKTYE
jgi:2-methylisocitrate lyase-like PEP mutase family enzyme